MPALDLKYIELKVSTLATEYYTVKGFPPNRLEFVSVGTPEGKGLAGQCHGQTQGTITIPALGLISRDHRKILLEESTISINELTELVTLLPWEHDYAGLYAGIPHSLFLLYEPEINPQIRAIIEHYAGW